MLAFYIYLYTFINEQFLHSIKVCHKILILLIVIKYSLKYYFCLLHVMLESERLKDRVGIPIKCKLCEVTKVFNNDNKAYKVCVSNILFEQGSDFC